jgi:hypothetical protein
LYSKTRYEQTLKIADTVDLFLVKFSPCHATHSRTSNNISLRIKRKQHSNHSGARTHYRKSRKLITFGFNILCCKQFMKLLLHPSTCHFFCFGHLHSAFGKIHRKNPVEIADPYVVKPPFSAIFNGLKYSLVKNKNVFSQKCPIITLFSHIIFNHFYTF